MSYVQEQQKRIMIEKLQDKAELSHQDLLDIVYACQIASGNATGVGKIKGIIHYLKQNSIHFLGQNGLQKISNKYELAKLIRSIDEYLDITSDRDFKDYF